MPGQIGRHHRHVDPGLTKVIDPGDDVEGAHDDQEDAFRHCASGLGDGLAAVSAGKRKLRTTFPGRPMGASSRSSRATVTPPALPTVRTNESAVHERLS